MVSGPRCRQCDIDFETVLQLNKHKAKFCTFSSAEEARDAAAFVRSHRGQAPQKTRQQDQSGNDTT
jgi:hypothetical protein